MNYLRLALQFAAIASVLCGAWWTWAAHARPRLVRPEAHALPRPARWAVLRWLAGAGFVIPAWLALRGLLGWMDSSSLDVLALVAALVAGLTAFGLVEAHAADRAR